MAKLFVSQQKTFLEIGKMKNIFLVLLAMALVPGQCLSAFAKSPAPGEVGELWHGKVLTATFRAGMCFDASGKARGVLLLRHRNGQQDAYHLYGTIKNNNFSLSHSSGHLFTGKLTGSKNMEGKVRLANGMTLNLQGERLQNAKLDGDDCSPPGQ